QVTPPERIDQKTNANARLDWLLKRGVFVTAASLFQRNPDPAESWSSGILVQRKQRKSLAINRA
ncbi:MAG: hypothetical protein ACK53V_15340, partial [Planctomycetota bacterium]